MKQKIKDLFMNILSSLITSIIIEFLKSGISIKPIRLNFHNFIMNISKYKFYIMWLVFFLLFVIFRWIIRRRIDNLQYNNFFSIQQYQYSLKFKYKGFNWFLFLNGDLKNKYISTKSMKFEDLENIKIGDVDGPFCINDNRTMRMKRTYFGFYKYTCPKCKYKKRDIKNINTLRADTLDEAKAKFR